MRKIKQSIWIMVENFRRWHKNPQIFFTFLLGFVVTYLLTDKVIKFTEERNTILQIFEPFIWVFGDSKSVLVVTLLLILLFSDIPDLNNHVPFELVRINRKIWMLGQILYLVSATFLYTAYLLVCSCVLASKQSFVGNQWSDTAAVLGYSELGESLSVPSYVKIMEFNSPLKCVINVFLLILGYSLLMTGILLFFNLWKRKGGMIGVIIFSAFGILMTPDILMKLLGLPAERMVEANIAAGWISPLNHATYYMHSFGYDDLPKVWFSYAVFVVGSVCVYGLSMIKIKNYGFSFEGTKR